MSHFVAKFKTIVCDKFQKKITFINLMKRKNIKIARVQKLLVTVSLISLRQSKAHWVPATLSLDIP